MRRMRPWLTLVSAVAVAKSGGIVVTQDAYDETNATDTCVVGTCDSDQIPDVDYSEHEKVLRDLLVEQERAKELKETLRKEWKSQKIRRGDLTQRTELVRDQIHEKNVRALLAFEQRLEQMHDEKYGGSHQSGRLETPYLNEWAKSIIDSMMAPDGDIEDGNILSNLRENIEDDHGGVILGVIKENPTLFEDSSKSMFDEKGAKLRLQKERLEVEIAEEESWNLFVAATAPKEKGSSDMDQCAEESQAGEIICSAVEGLTRPLSNATRDSLVNAASTAQVVYLHGLTSPTYAERSGSNNVLDLAKDKARHLLLAQSADSILTHSSECWPFEGSSGQVTLRFAEPVLATSIDFITGIGSESAPRYVAVHGYRPCAETDHNCKALTGFDVNAKELLHEDEELTLSKETESSPWQSFPLRAPSFKNEEDDEVSCSLSCTAPPQHAPEDGLVQAVTIRIYDNWGHPSYTCINGIQIRGNRK